MNWFKFQKLAMPLVENDERDYFDIGHYGFDPLLQNATLGPPTKEKMWLIDDDWSFFEQPAFDETDHSTFTTNSGENGHNGGIARGRFCIDEKRPEGEASVIFTILENQPNLSVQRKEYIKHKVVGILEKNYGAGVNIMEFW